MAGEISRKKQSGDSKAKGERDASEPSNLKDGERRVVTVLFTDMVDFTPLSEHMDPEEMDQLMNGLFSRFESIVKRHGGSVEKYIGDAMVAVFGVPQIHEDDAVRAVNAAIDFVDSVDSFARRFMSHRTAKAGTHEAQKPDITIRFRTGLHTGLITTGRRGEFDVVTGHTMNVAARIQQNANPGGIFVSQSTLDECGNDFVVSDPVSIDGKGLSDQLCTYQVMSRNRQYLSPEPVFIGRKDLVDELVSHYMRHSGSSPGGFLILGDAGIGKTAVVRKFIEKVRKFPDFHSPVLWARAREFRSLPFATIAELIINFTKLDTRWDEDKIRDTLVSQFGIAGQAAADFSHLLKDSMPDISDRTGTYTLLWGIVRKILQSTQDSPYAPIIFIDNSNLIDIQSLDSLSHFIKSHKHLPFFIFAEREPRIDLTNSLPHLVQREVPPMSPEESRELLSLLIPGTGPDANLGAEAETILRNAEGNPLFLRAYARLAENRNSESGDVPQTLQSLFLSTVSSYNDDIRDFLKKLSVFQVNFSSEDAYYVHEKTDGDISIVDSALNFFEQEEIIWKDRGNYYFRHDVFKRALYNSLLNYNKKILHGLVVDLMKRQPNPHPVRLVYHLIKCERLSEAVEVLKESPGANINLDFVPHIDALLAGIGEGDDRRTLVLKKAALLFNNGMMEDSDEILKDLLSHAFSKTDSDYAAGAYHMLVAYNTKCYRFQKAEFCGTKALAYYEKLSGNETARASVLQLLLTNATYDNKGSQTDGYLSALADLARCSAQAALADAEARIHRALLMGRAREAAEILRLQQNEEDRMLDLAWQIRWQLADMESTVAMIRTHMESDKPGGVDACNANTVLAMAENAMGIHANLESIMDQAEFLGTRIHNDFDYIEACKSLAEAWLCLGRPDKAEQKALEGLILGQRHSAFYPVFGILSILVELSVSQGRKDQAEFFLDEACHIESLGPLTDRRDRIVLLYHKAKLRKSADDLEAAGRLLDEEETQIGNPKAFERFLGLRGFARIHREIAESRVIASTPAARV